MTMYVLDQLSTYAREQFGFNASTLSVIASISPARLKLIERSVEPTLGEALHIASCLSCAIVPDLMSPPTDPPALRADVIERHLAAHRAGMGLDLPLGAAVEIAAQLDVQLADLDVSALTRRMWTVMSEHIIGSGLACPWCLMSAGEHLPSCLPANLWGSLSVINAGALIRSPLRKGQQRQGELARGLKAVRRSSVPRRKQREAAEFLLVSVDTYSKYEQCANPLPYINADALAAYFNVPVRTLYDPPEGAAVDIVPGASRESAAATCGISDEDWEARDRSNELPLPEYVPPPPPPPVPSMPGAGVPSWVDEPIIE